MEAGVPIVASLLGLGILGVWASTWFTSSGVKPRSLVTGKPAGVHRPTSIVPMPGPGVGTPTGPPPTVTPMPGEWPGFRGAQRDNIAPAETKVPAGVQGLGLAWKVPRGAGYAGPAVKDGRVFVLDYDSAARQDVLRCFSLAEGKELWRNAYPSDAKRNHGISRTVPATDGRVVVSLGPKGMVLCADVATGQTKWSLDLGQAYGTQIPEWYVGQCPLIENGRLILAPAGSSLMVALDLATGKPVWQTPNPAGWKMTHSSISAMEVGGERTYVYCGSGGVAGVSAKDGRLLWQSPEWTVNTATVPSPVPVGDGKVFLSGGYNAGSLMLQVANTGNSWSAKPLFRLGPEVFGSDLQTPILYRGKLYGVAPNGEMVCLGLDGKRVWGSGTAARFGLGSYLVADGKMLALNDNGALTIADASPVGFRSYGKIQVLQGRESWGPMAVAGDRLLARDFESLVCIRLGGS